MGDAIDDAKGVSLEFGWDGVITPESPSIVALVQDEDEEEESDALVNQVLDEIGIEMNNVSGTKPQPYQSFLSSQEGSI